MIIQAARLRTTLSLSDLVQHVFAGATNRKIEALHAGPEDLAVMCRDAAEAGKKYAIRHYKISREWQPPGSTSHE